MLEFLRLIKNVDKGEKNIMSNNIADVVVHIDETLTANRLKIISEVVNGMNGVVSVSQLEDKPHLMIVTYGPDNVNSKEILAKVKHEGCHAELVGL